METAEDSPRKYTGSNPVLTTSDWLLLNNERSEKRK